MSLIEQLGGYEAAKEWYKDQDLRGNHTTRIRAALLEHRRQHNIFEVGDKVVRCDGDIDFLFNIEGHKGLKVKVSSNQFNNELWSSIHLFKHATDKEIAAGQRL